MSRAARKAMRILAQSQESTDPNHLSDPGQFLLDSGLLFEINRRVLHPLGMALEVEVGDGPGTSKVGGVWDYRDDPEGIRFDEAQFRSGVTKLARFMDSFGKAKHAQRQQILGFVVQGER